MRWLIAVTTVLVSSRADADVANDVTVEPVGAVFKVFAAEYERAVAAHVSAFAEVAVLAGLELPDRTDETYTGAGLRVGGRWFPFQPALRGAFAGLEVHGTFGSISTDDTGRAIGVAPLVGYSFVIRDRLDLSLGLGVELNASNLENDHSRMAFVVQPLPRASIGVAF